MQTKKILDTVKFPSDLKKLTDNELKILSNELRQETISIVSQTGGHLGSSLGVIELTVAIHSVFNTPFDKLIWDVSHQCYPHKILTGRRKGMMTLRQEKGLSGFTKRSESEYDPFGAAHSSTSISAALGFTVARDLGSRVGDSIAVIGDGSISAGMAYEGLNNAGSEGRRLFVILNDNEMSIAPPAGAMSKYLSSLYANNEFHSLTKLAEGLAKSLPAPLQEGARRAKSLITGMASGGTFFEELGFSYLGPINGHDMDQLLPVLRAVKARASGPILIHCVTKKGKGYEPAETSSDKYHGVAKFDVASGEQRKSKPNAPSYTGVFGKELVSQAKSDPLIVAITAAMPSGTGLNLMEEVFPERTFDVGIAEQHAVTFAAGLATENFKPYAAIYSTFLQRAYDQVVHDVAIQSLPVRFAIDRAGLVGADGSTHAGSFDITYLATLPNFIVMAASDEAELVKMINTSVDINDKPSAIRYPRGTGIGIELPSIDEKIEIGKGRVIQEGKQACILSLGTRLEECKLAAEELKNKGISTTIVDARFAKPLDQELILKCAREHEVMITIEEGSIGGFGSHVKNLLADKGIFDKGLKFRSMTLPDSFLEQDTPKKMYELAGLNSSQISKKISDILFTKDTIKVVKN